MTRDPLLPVRLVDGVWTTEGAGSAAVPTDDAPPSTSARDFPCDPYPPPWVKVVSIVADQSTDATERQPGIMVPMTWPAPAEPDLTIPWMPWGYDKTEPRQWAKPGAEEGTVEIGGQTFRAEVATWGEPGVKVRNMRCIPEPDLSEITIPVTMDTDEARKVAEHVLAHGQRTIFAALHPRGYLYALGDTEADARENALSRRDINRDEARSVGVDFPPPETDTAWADELIFVTVSGAAESLRVYVAAVDDVIPWCPADLWDNPTPPEEP
jgi:hypothetical protein